MSNVFYVKRGSVGLDLVVTLAGADGTVQDLTGATLAFRMRRKGRSTTTTTTATVAADAPATSGVARVSWGANDLTQPPGRYLGEIRVTLPNSKLMIFPTGDPARDDDYIQIEIQDEID